MMKSKGIWMLCMLLLGLFAHAQNRESLLGLWAITRVEVGEKEMTPDGRWARLNEDGTQQSGNGWFQHSYGNWTYNEDTNELSIETVNGIKDPFGSFRVVVDGDAAKWYREEEGEQVEVSLERTDSLPSSLRDRLLGLWKMTEISGAGAIYEEDDLDEGYLFIRWDGKFVANVAQGKIFGVYNVHAHKPEIDLIPYGQRERTWWKVELADELTIQLINSEEDVRRTFSRVKSYE